MTLTNRTDFALRTLMYLAANSEKRATSSEIARRFEIPTNHLIKIINELARRGYVRTVRGPGGGVEIARDTSEIQLGEVIEDLQGPVRLHDCVATRGICPIQPVCRLKGILKQADNVQAEFLNQFTLADIIPNLPERREATDEEFDPCI